MADWDLRKVVNDADRLAEFDDFATYFFEVICSHVKKEHDKRKETGQGPVTQVTMLIDVKNYSYAQLMNFRGIVILIPLLLQQNYLNCFIFPCSYQQTIANGGNSLFF